MARASPELPISALFPARDESLAFLSLTLYGPVLCCISQLAFTGGRRRVSQCFGRLRRRAHFSFRPFSERGTARAIRRIERARHVSERRPWASTGVGWSGRG